MNTKTISKISKNDLCTNCGTCVALCPKNLIKLKINHKKGLYVPQINTKDCNNCEICYKSCPGNPINYNEYNLEISGKKPINPIIGNYSKCYIGHSRNHSIRYNSSSGGLITQVLIHALEEGIIDGALVTRMKKNEPLEPEPFIAQTKEEIIEASKSKYCPVPVNIALKEIINSKNKKFAVVGLPCHLQGIIKAKRINKKLDKKICLLLGIFCSHVDSFKGTQFLLEKSGLNMQNVDQIDYRGNGWPGSIKINSKENSITINNLTPLSNIFHPSRFFINKRCLYCSDFSAEFADISFGDAWLNNIIKKDKLGCSLIISRSNKAETLLNDAFHKEKIYLSQINSDKVIDSQKEVIHFKKINVQERIKIGKIFNKNLESLLLPEQQLSLYNKPLAYISFLNYHLWLNYWFLMKHIPLKLLVKYFGLIWFLSSFTLKKDENKLYTH
jgi:coenzyme F420 hydrogenase subunit beta